MARCTASSGVTALERARRCACSWASSAPPRAKRDQASPLDVELYRKYFSEDCLLVIGLGATETGLTRQYFVDKTMQLNGGNVPLGYPVENMELLILSEDGSEVDAGTVGEIAFRSEFLAVGYWQRDDLTEASFVTDARRPDQRVYRSGDLGRLLPDGALEFLGQKDSRVKVRGYTVELGEVEAALLEMDVVREAVVVARGDQGEKELLAYLVAKKRYRPSTSELNQSLRQKLPHYMLPTEYVHLEALPLSSNGKVDRRALSALPLPAARRSARDAGFVAPRDRL